MIQTLSLFSLFSLDYRVLFTAPIRGGFAPIFPCEGASLFFHNETQRKQQLSLSKYSTPFAACHQANLIAQQRQQLIIHHFLASISCGTWQRMRDMRPLSNEGYSGAGDELGLRKQWEVD